MSRQTGGRRLGYIIGEKHGDIFIAVVIVDVLDQAENLIHLVLHITNTALNGNDCIVLGKHDAELTAGTVTAESVTGIDPELITVSGAPIDRSVA